MKNRIKGPEDEDELIDWDETAEREADEADEWADSQEQPDYSDDYDWTNMKTIKVIHIHCKESARERRLRLYLEEVLSRRRSRLYG